MTDEQIALKRYEERMSAAIIDGLCSAALPWSVARELTERFKEAVRAAYNPPD